MKKRSLVVATAIATIAALGSPAAQAGGDHDDKSSCRKRNNNTTKKLLECVTLKGVRQHQAKFQRFADRGDGTRLAGTSGYDDSVEYVAEKLDDAGYKVEIQEFTFTGYRPLGPSTLEQTAPTPTTYVEETDYTLLDQTDPGDVEAPVTAVDLMLGPGNTSTSGCEASDFTGFPSGNIALIQRGTCTFEIKVENAAAAGAVGAIFFNQGNTPDRTGLAAITLSANNTSGIPAVMATYDRGVEWSGISGLTMHIVTDVFRGPVDTSNVLAETRKGDDENVVMAGAHLDSVAAGPGINDNGSGSAALLETAIQMQKVKPKNTVRFAWWGAEESVLVGSTFYVSSLAPEELDNIALYLNFDMIGSPNFVRFIYDGDGSAGLVGGAGPPGSEDIEALWLDYFGDRGLATEPTAFDGRSDYGPFIAAGIPAGGLFSGAEGIKTAAQAATYGGIAGEQYDPCYHEVCDTFDGTGSGSGATAPGLGPVVLDQFSDAMAFAVLTYSKDVSSVG